MSLLFEQRTILFFLMHLRQSVSVMNQGCFDYPKCTHLVKLYQPPIVSKLFLIKLHFKDSELARKYSSRMRTSRLPTVCVLVVTTRCQYQRDMDTMGLGTPTPTGQTNPWTYPPPEHAHSSLLLVTPGGRHWRHTHPHGQTDRHL